MLSAGDAAFLRIWPPRKAALVEVVSVDGVGQSTFAVVETKTPVLDWSVAGATGAPWPIIEAGKRFSCLLEDLVPIPDEMA
jgi:hypothetical protein